MPKKITIIGGAGFIGTMLTAELISRGYAVTVVDKNIPRTQHNKAVYIQADVSKNLEPSMLEGSFGIVNLAGAPISKRWTTAYKEIIYNSRINTTKNIVTALSLLKEKPSVLVSASAVGYYAGQNEKNIFEDSPAGTDFLAHVCSAWEKEASNAEALGIRTVIIRTSNVLGPGGLLASLTPLFKKGLGGYFGSGKQYMPWVHWKDILGIYIFALEHDISGPHNTAAPEAVSQKTLFTAFARSLHVSLVWPIPYFFGRIVVGEFASALIISQKVDSTKIVEEGYVFQAPTLNEAFSDGILRL